MRNEDFYKKLKAVKWDKGIGKVVDLIKENKDKISAKSKDGSTLIQTLLNLPEDDDDIDLVVLQVIDFTSDDALNETGKNKESPLFCAVVMERHKVVDKLLARKADVNIRNYKDRVPLHSASFNGDVTMVEKLLPYNEELVLAQDHQDTTPLDMACWKGHNEVVKFLLTKDRGALDLVDHESMSPLYTAVRNGHVDIVRTLVEQASHIIDKPDEDDCTALDCAAMKGYTEIAKLLLEHGANIECRDNKGFTPLVTASTMGHADLIEMLLEYKADPLAQNFERKSGLMLAGRFGYTPIVRRLLEIEIVREAIDEVNKDDATSLLVACRYGEREAVSMLLQAGADCTIPDSHGRTPLMEASKWRYPSVVELLLKQGTRSGMDMHRFVCSGNEDLSGFTALQYACYYGHLRIAEILVRHGVDINATDKEGRTPLHNASRQGYREIVELLCKKVTDIDMIDNKGWTALHHASFSEYNDEDALKDEDLGHEPYPDMAELDPVPRKHVEILQCLLNQGADAWMINHEGQTPLLLAAMNGRHSRVGILLENVRTSEDLSIRDNHNTTALHRALEEKNSDIVRQLLQRLETTELDDTSDRDELMLWLAKRQETHEILCLLLSKDHEKGDPSPPAAGGWGALEWATYRGYEKFVWWLLFSTHPSRDRDRTLSSAETIANGFVAKMKEKGQAGGKKSGDPLAKGGKQEDESKEATSMDTDSEDNRLQILLILRNPPMTQTAGERQELKQSSDKPVYQPHSADLINHYMAEVVDFYSFDNYSGFLRRFATVKDVIYVRGPEEIMEEARDRTHKLDSRFGPSDGTAASDWDEDNVNVRWIHLPANNMKWMNDLAQAVSAESEIDGGGLAWLDQSWDQVLGKNRSSRFMKPKCLYRSDRPDSKKGDEWEDDSDEESSGSDSSSISTSDDDSNAQMAIYMPYLTLAKHGREPEAFLPEYKHYQQLIDDYRDVVVHGTRTLDEFYYHSCEDENLRQDIIYRNEDQVLSKTIYGSVAGLDTWVLLNVDQVWIWVIDEKTIITCSTHRKDDVEDPLLTAVLDTLSQANGTRNAGPKNTREMSRLIIDTCVGFFDREFPMNITTKIGEVKVMSSWKGSVQDIFTNAIAQAALKETKLYGQFASEKGSGRSEKRQGPEATHKRREILEAATLFREIKDIRDELKMLKTISEFQTVVQKECPSLRTRASQTLSSRSVFQNLRELDKSAERIENAVNTTLGLEQNEISISQAQEAVSQGRTLMLFTVVTILFLPLSFFTSFFALDVASFLQTPPWAFLVLFCISFGIFGPLATYAFYSDSITGSYHKLVAYFKKDEPKPPELDTRIFRPMQHRGTFNTMDTGRTSRPRSVASVEIEKGSTRKGMSRRARTKGHYDEESLSPKAYT